MLKIPELVKSAGRYGKVQATLFVNFGFSDFYLTFLSGGYCFWVMKIK